jgi:hypothetical protein
MSDARLNYWENWLICGDPSDSSKAGESAIVLCDLRQPPYTYDHFRLSDDPDYLLDVITHHPRPLEDQAIHLHIIKYRNLAKKDKEAREIYSKIHKLLSLDGRKAKLRSEEEWEGLTCDIYEDIEFFSYMINQRHPQESDVQAIERWLGERLLVQLENYRTTYYSYLNVYRRLTNKLTSNEAFVFLKYAADHVRACHIIYFTLNGTPDGRGLVFFKLEGDKIINP